ncbi:MAG: acyclic terpene utilization AtuA family protein [Rhodospirillaceae bacterium]
MMKPGKHGRDIVRIGTGAGMADDRVYPAVQLLERGDLDYLVCECLAERTIARESLDRSRNPERGYTPMLEERLHAFLPLMRKHDVCMVTNMGAANPLSAARVVRRIARELGLDSIPCAAVVGDDVTELVRAHPELPLMESGEPVESVLPRMASANAYLGADVIRDALATGAEVVITGRVADPSLYLGVLLHHFGWSYDDLPLLATGIVAGHLLECSTQVTGGYFADPGKKEVANLADLPYPYADVTRGGALTLGKTPNSGGRLDVMTCTEQLLYEIHDPARYITPDCVVDITDVDLAQDGPDRVKVAGARATPRTATYKAVVGYFDGYIGCGEVSYAGINAVARARLAAEVVKERLRMQGFAPCEYLVDLVGMTSLHGDNGHRPEPYEVRLRVAGRCPDRRTADALGDAVRQLNMQGPSGPGAATNIGPREIIAVKSVLLPREWVHPEVVMEEPG